MWFINLQQGGQFFQIHFFLAAVTNPNARGYVFHLEERKAGGQGAFAYEFY